ncbi:conserved hypothetical protein [Leishmania mexicana MHOM/GT/2001/U1103]|uniref:Uncharacterized protein n=1 Tax=Leishmania mexicana (strain MHOM/GT/2001/U1103) TaxID=929439 RepID=E9AXH8_LEIMU|nr:conserved hypothetical protein [Leishmania mexicana MHOM/GT/2001/U1103]CBZ27669.1 conserved hypothetical protein [Leishmania mexicana MHOM/GT/2001/U1103]
MFSSHSSPGADELAEELRQQLAPLQGSSDHIQQPLTALGQHSTAPASASTHDEQSNELNDEPQHPVPQPQTAVQPPGQKQSEHDGVQDYPVESAHAKPQPAKEMVQQGHEPSQSAEPPGRHAGDSTEIPGTQEAQTSATLHSVLENDEDDTNPLTYNLPSAAQIQELPSCHLLTSAHTPDMSLHRTNLSASQHSSYATSIACPTPIRNTHAGPDEPTPPRHDSAGPPAAYAIDPVTAREAGEHAERSEEAVQPPGQKQSEHDGVQDYPVESAHAKPQPAKEMVQQGHEPSQSAEPPGRHAGDSTEIPGTQEAQTSATLHSVLENDEDDTNPLTYNLPSAAQIQELPSCHLLTSAHTPDMSLHRTNLSASQHSSYAISIACPTPIRNTHAGPDEPTPPRHDSAGPPAAYAIDPVTAREAGEHAEPRRSDNESPDVDYKGEREDAACRAAAPDTVAAGGVSGLPSSASVPRVLDKHGVSGAQRRLSDCGAVKRGASGMTKIGLPQRCGENHARGSALVSRTRSPPPQQPGYVNLYASKKSEPENAQDPERILMEQASVVDGELAVFVSSSLLPVSRHLFQKARLATTGEQGHHGACAAPAMSVAATAYASSVSTSNRACDEAGALTSTAPTRFELSSAANGDVVERDMLAGRQYWAAENPKTTSYIKPSALLEAKEKRECTLFRRYSHWYKKLVEDSAVHVGGEAGASILRSHEAFKQACETADQKPIHKRNFYEGPIVDWKKLLLEQAAGMSNISKGAA